VVETSNLDQGPRDAQGRDGAPDALATVDTAVNEAILLRKEPGKALADAAAKANQILEQNRKKYGG